ncbi:hypothetical protein Clacol_000487 [Clathrus columnatus]|uniref:Uncharacterized protein n=1 Tax=Clathrus columnatus TaxID=1419009 RepID=A0AAV4ZZU7_9AGAM|nr:hypothetical protein Clacol_000487 [Clathrus columnatus]
MFKSRYLMGSINAAKAYSIKDHESSIEGRARTLRAGLEQTLKGFKDDMIVMNHDSELKEVYPALQKLEDDLKACEFSFSRSPQTEGVSEPNEDFEESKLEYISFSHDATPSTPAQLTRSISKFIAQNRARNNLSNRNEFLRKRRRIVTTADDTGVTTEVDTPTCARTDAIPINRDAQIKYDIAKNEHGPLTRTYKPGRNSENQQYRRTNEAIIIGKAVSKPPETEQPTLQKHPGLAERFSNFEDHLAVRYVPSPPVSLLDRIRLLEEHIIRLERDYPPWAALHFKQPNRGWPPPPRATPLIVPTHLTSASNLAVEVETSTSTPAAAVASQVIPPIIIPRPGSSKLSKKKSSSLHRAVLEKLEVKKALAGED